MYEKLLKSLRVEPFEVESVGLAKIMNDAADAIEELSKPKWIPVTERLPECEGERVLVASNFLTSYLRVSICYFSKNLEDVDKYKFANEKRSGFYAHDPDYGHYERQCVRCWMPLPQPPKEG